MKNVSVIVSGAAAGDVREVSLLPGITAADVLRNLRLDGYLLSVEGSVTAFAAEEQIYDRVPDGGKLRATPISEVGH
jgi:hypothetical protein